MYLTGPSPVLLPSSNKIQTNRHILACLTSPPVSFPIPLLFIHSALVTMPSCCSSNKPCHLASESLCTVFMAPPQNVLEACSFISFIFCAGFIPGKSSWSPVPIVVLTGAGSIQVFLSACPGVGQSGKGVVGIGCSQLKQKWSQSLY